MPDIGVLPMNIKDINELIDNYYKNERGKGRKVSGIFSGGHYGATKGIRDLMKFVAQIQGKSKRLEHELTNDETEKLMQILAKRWMEISASDKSYISDFDNPTNDVYIVIAQILGEELGIEPILILMPTIENAKTPIMKNDVDLSRLNTYFLMDDKKHLIPYDEIYDQYLHAYKLLNPFTNEPYNDNEIARIENNSHNGEAIVALQSRISTLHAGISPELIIPLREFIDVALSDLSENLLPDRLGKLSIYINSLPETEHNILMQTQLGENITFAEVCNLLTPEVCSHTVLRNYLIPFLNRLESEAGEALSFQHYVNYRPG